MQGSFLDLLAFTIYTACPPSCLCLQMVGPILSEATKPLPIDLATFVESGKGLGHGAVFVSMGTAAHLTAGLQSIQVTVKLCCLCLQMVGPILSGAAQPLPSDLAAFVESGAGSGYGAVDLFMGTKHHSVQWLSAYFACACRWSDLSYQKRLSLCQQT